MYFSSFYENDVTPPLGSIIPGDFKARYNERVADKLYLRAFIIYDGTEYIAVISIDACGLTKDITDSIKKRVMQFIPLSYDQIMITATHTHGGGPTLNWGEEVIRNEFYIDMLIIKAADSLICAYHNMKPAELKTGVNELNSMSYIRIYRMKDGKLKTNPGVGNPNVIEPIGEIDPSVTVLTVFQNKRPVGVLVNFSCHPAIVANVVTSADYIGVLSSELKLKYGNDFVTVFINGACGNINHINVFDPKTVKPDRYITIGKALSDKVTEIIDNSATLSGKLNSQSKTIKGKIRKPSAEDLSYALKHFESLGDELYNSSPGTVGYINTFFALQAFKIASDKRSYLDIYLQILNIGRLRIFCIPCQMFVEFGRILKQNSTAPINMVSIFSNDYLGYVPTAECMTEGVYEARLATTSMLHSNTGYEICNSLADISLLEYT